LLKESLDVDELREVSRLFAESLPDLVEFRDDGFVFIFSFCMLSSWLYQSIVFWWGCTGLAAIPELDNEVFETLAMFLNVTVELRFKGARSTF